MQNRRYKKIAGYALRWTLLAVAVALTVHLLSGIAWADLTERLRAADPRFVGLAVIALLGRYPLWAWRWRQAVARLGPGPGGGPLLAMTVGSMLVNHLTPAARVLGGVLRGRYLAAAGGGSLGRAYGSVLFDQLAHQAAMIGMMVAGLLAAALVVGRRSTAALVVAAVLAVAFLALWLRRRSSGDQTGGLARLAGYLASRGGGETRVRRAFSHGREAVEALGELLEDGRLVARALSLGIGYALLNALAQWALFLAIGSRPNFAVVLAAVSLGVAAGSIAGTPGGLGATEAAIIASFVAFGVDRLDATAATLLYRGLHYVVVLAGGAPALLWLEARYGGGGTADDGGAAPEPRPGETA